MNRIYLRPDESIDEENKRFLIQDQGRILHIRDHLKKSLNDSLKILVIDGGVGSATIVELDEKGILLHIDEIQKMSHPRLTFSVGLCRPPSMKKIIEHGTTMGVSDFHFFETELTEKSFRQSKVLTKKSFDKLTSFGLMQSGYYYIRPSLNISKTLPVPQSASAFLLDPKGEPFSKEDFQTDHIHFCLGPERGMTEVERRNLIDKGFKPRTLGAPILRVEHAVFSTAAVYHFLVQ